MPQRLAELAFALEQLDRVRIFAPALAQHFNGNDLAGVRIFGPENAAKAAGSNLVKHPVAAQEVTVLLTFEKFVALPRGEVAFALELAH